MMDKKGERDTNDFRKREITLRRKNNSDISTSGQ